MGRKCGGWPAVLALPLLLSGCLITLGGPLSRRVEPGRWRVEAAAGPSLTNEYGTLNALAYGYAGRSLGKHWELGALPYGYSWGGEGVVAAAFPVRWDPFPYSWAVHLVPFAGPVLFWAPGLTVGMGGMTGLGLSLRVGELAEFYASGSAFVPEAKFLSSSVGARFDLANGFELGLGAVLVGSEKNATGDSQPIVLGSITVSTLLGPH
jgi:hypothetical protein